MNSVIEGLSIRIYFDHHVQDRFGVDLRREGFDVVTAREVGLERATDEIHLQWATDHDRVVFTQDLRDFPTIAANWFLQGKEHAGIIVSVQPGRTPYGEMLRRMLRLLDTLTAEDMVNRVEWLDSRWSEPNEE